MRCGGSIFGPCVVSSYDANSVVVTTPIGSVGKVLVISLQLNDGSRLDTNHTFTYRPEPVVTDIQPRNHLVVYVSYD